ncbi:MAG TPA: NAD-dependent epimerase/dehydratase family protein [Candidatus Dormibacteraeota bacterium]|nr:NAD-dependent epimerase/dehydratase family protein [Candidatus Dormibacteraeota bacterium]
MPRLLITGGAGFVGINAASHFLSAGWSVTLLDNLSRAGSERNLSWARAEFGPRLAFIRADVRDPAALRGAVLGQDAILHLAAQVAVTTSIVDPITDFEVNAAGTVNLLEAVREQVPEAVLVYASTNKVYGQLIGVERPVDENLPLDPHGPYGCSKGAADQYVRDYARVFGLRTVVLRQSCIYGRHQYGTEDQGWLAHFVHSVLARRPITIFGDGHQVRDLLDVRDLCRLYAIVIDRIEDCRGQAFNIGGGPDNARSLLDAIDSIAQLTRVRARYSFADLRPGDQRYYVSDIARVGRVLGWQPQVGVQAGLEHLVEWAVDLPERLQLAS